MSKHTPGPWTVFRSSSNRPGIDGRNGNFSIVVYGQRDEDDSGIHGKTQDEELANARLIAAAPELLAACKAIRNEVADLAKGFESGDAADRTLAAGWKRLVANCDAAIAKAEAAQ